MSILIFNGTYKLFIRNKHIILPYLIKIKYWFKMLGIKFLIIIMFDCFVCVSCVIATIQNKINKKIITLVVGVMVTVNLFVVLMTVSENNLTKII